MSEPSKKTEFLVGVFLFFGLLLLAGLVVQFGRFGDRFRGRYPLTVVFDDASGLIKGSEVRMGGARVGSVAEAPELNAELKAQVSLSIADTIRIPEGSSFMIDSVGVLGDKMIVVTPPLSSGRGAIAEGAVIKGGGKSGTDAILSNAEAVSRDARKLMVEAESAFRKVDGAIDELREATSHVTATLKKVNESILSPENLEHVDGAMANFEKTTEAWARASEALEPTIVEARESIRTIGKAAESAERTFVTAEERIRELSPALKEVPRAVAALSGAAEKVGTAIERVESGKGLLGTLAYDREVSEDAKTFIRNLKQQGILRYRDVEGREGGKVEELSPEDDPRNRFRGRRR